MNQKVPPYFVDLIRLMRAGNDAESKIASINQAIALADTHNDIRGGMMARLQFLRVAVFNGRHEEALVHFAWCIAQCDRNPRVFEVFQHDILWQFKWILSSVPKFSNISRAQIEQTFGQMTTYYDKAGASHRAINGLRAQAAIYLGDLDQIPRHRDAWIAAPKDGLQDCAACEASTQVELFLAANQPDRAVEVADDLIAGRANCGEQPEVADSHLLVPLFRLKQFALAQRLQRRSFEKVRSNREYFPAMGRYLAFLAATDQQPRGIDMLEALSRELPHVRRGFDRLAGLKGAALFVRRMRDAGHSSLKLRMPPDVAIHRSDGVYTLDSLIRWFSGEAAPLAAEFDKRNGNSVMSRSLGDYDDLLTSIHPLADSADEHAE